MKLTFIEAGEVTAKGNICLKFDLSVDTEFGTTKQRVFLTVSEATAKIPAVDAVINTNNFDVVVRDGYHMLEAKA